MCTLKLLKISFSSSKEILQTFSWDSNCYFNSIIIIMMFLSIILLLSFPPWVCLCSTFFTYSFYDFIFPNNLVKFSSFFPLRINFLNFLSLDITPPCHFIVFVTMHWDQLSHCLVQITICVIGYHVQIVVKAFFSFYFDYICFISLCVHACMYKSLSF